MNTKKIVLVGGCFDVIHYGHINFLEKARALGDKLIVALESDANIRKLKGVNRPFHTQQQRKEMLLSVKYVDKVINLPQMNTDFDYEKFVLKISPGIIAVTQGDPIISKKRAQAKKVGAKVVVIPKIKNVSTSTLVKILAFD